MIVVLSIACGLVMFVSTVFAFGLGVKYGIAIKNGVQPKIEPFKKKKEPEVKADENAIKNLMGYKGETY